jgi:hypothetical protein
VEWSRLSGDEVEAVVSILICRDHPTATRVKPSQGDGGIDVWVPAASGSTVYQIKGYTGLLTAARKRHIRGSWDRLLSYLEANQLTLESWFLVTPENPTTQNLKWLNELIEGARFDCFWRGLDFVDGLAAKYPDVIDYYLRDGKDRLDQAIQRYAGLTGMGNKTGSPSEMSEGLNEIHALLNSCDPHYRYDFAVESLGSDGEPPQISNSPGMVCAVQSNDGERCVTFKIIARYNGATDDRPIPGGMTIGAEEGTELAHQIEEFMKFGTPLEKIPAKNVFLRLPGGFEAAPGDALVSVGAPRPTSTRRAGIEVTMQVVEIDGSPIAELDFITDEVTAGFQQQGVRGVGHDASAGAVRYELRMHQRSTTATVNLEVEDMVGRQPADLLPVLHFLDSMRPGRLLQLGVRNGPTLSEPWAIPSALVTEDQGRLWIDVCENLAEIQKHTFNKILMPDLGQHTWDDLEKWSQAAILLRGEAIEGTWTEARIHLYPGIVAADDERTVMVNQPLTVTIGADTYDLGVVGIHALTLQVDSSRASEVHDDHLDVWVVPGRDPRVTTRLVAHAATGAL